jgi:hypothetical protein
MDVPAMGANSRVPDGRAQAGSERRVASVDREKVAEREGFEPSMGCPIPHFQCGALGL